MVDKLLHCTITSFLSPICRLEVGFHILYSNLIERTANIITVLIPPDVTSNKLEKNESNFLTGYKNREVTL